MSQPCAVQQLAVTVQSGSAIHYILLAVSIHIAHSEVVSALTVCSLASCGGIMNPFLCGDEDKKAWVSARNMKKQAYLSTEAT